MKVEDLYTDQNIAVSNAKFGLKVGSIGKVYGYSNSSKCVTVIVAGKKYSGDPKYLIGICGD